MSNLEKLYYNFSKLNDDYRDTTEVREAWNSLENLLGKEKYEDCESEMAALSSANEKQGFINGFQYAVSLLMSGKAV